MLDLVRLKKRSQFLKIARTGHKVVRRTVVLQGLKFAKNEQIESKAYAHCSHVKDAIFLGFTASKKVGNAVTRNRAKRRLVAASAKTLPHMNLDGWGFVLIARASTATAPFQQLNHDLHAALVQISKS